MQLQLDHGSFSKHPISHADPLVHDKQKRLLSNKAAAFQYQLLSSNSCFSVNTGLPTNVVSLSSLFLISISVQEHNFHLLLACSPDAKVRQLCFGPEQHPCLATLL